ncbi:hypothetical protein CLV74_1261 [Donghicola tyrosinivorans]|uniref:Uncharacterized protein n=1 Tax=Donghicola tyrosinivorans TaxID=1652492 RepID=A0A2T0WC39_9RHOB|nr:hypothetical protein CLV74_1261 [Donghicola tyrosinivorans]
MERISAPFSFQINALRGVSLKEAPFLKQLRTLLNFLCARFSFF